MGDLVWGFLGVGFWNSGGDGVWVSIRAMGYTEKVLKGLGFDAIMQGWLDHGQGCVVDEGHEV